MLEILYRIYEVADKDTSLKNLNKDLEFGLYSSISKAENIELMMDVCICESWDEFKEIIKSQYGDNISFKYSKKLNVGDLYCVIIGEHCYNSEKYFNKVTFTCDNCGSKVETYLGRYIKLQNYEIKDYLYNIEEYKDKKFCCNNCKEKYLQKEREKVRPDDNTEFFVTRDMFSSNISGYIYKITKKSTGEFYIGQTAYVPIFRWGQHLKTERFPVENICDYQFEVIEIVPKEENILKREEYYIKEYYHKNPEKSLNIVHANYKQERRSRII